MGKCKNCKWWKQITNDPVIPNRFGNCKEFVYTDYSDLPKDPDSIYLAIDEYGGEAFVGENFGCIHFERRRK